MFHNYTYVFFGALELYRLSFSSSLTACRVLKMQRRQSFMLGLARRLFLRKYLFFFSPYGMLFVTLIAFFDVILHANCLNCRIILLGVLDKCLVTTFKIVLRMLNYTVFESVPSTMLANMAR